MNLSPGLRVDVQSRAPDVRAIAVPASSAACRAGALAGAGAGVGDAAGGFSTLGSAGDVFVVVVEVLVAGRGAAGALVAPSAVSSSAGPELARSAWARS